MSRNNKPSDKLVLNEFLKSKNKNINKHDGKIDE